MRDPYQVLGVSRDAADEEIKKAYRALSRKYHPDANVNNPNKEQAEEKFKEIQQAYQKIMDMRQNGGGAYESGGGYQSGGYGNFGDFGDFFGGYGGGGRAQNTAGQDEYTIHMNAALNYIRSRHFQEALNVLAGISDRTAQWYYYSSIANSGMGNNVLALDHARKAYALEPGSQEYLRWKQQIESGGSWYQSQQSFYGAPVTDGGNLCLRLCIANMLLNMCCGGGGLCCGGGVPIGRF